MSRERSRQSSFARTLVCCLVLGLCLSLCFPGQARAEGEGAYLLGPLPIWPSPDVVGIVPMGMGAAGIALADGIEGLYINPAGLWRRRKTYLIEGGYYFHPQADGRVFNVAVADSTSNPILSGGLAYSYYVAPRPDDGKVKVLSGNIVRLGLSLALAKTFFLGTTLKYLNLARPFHPNMEALTVDLGLIWQINKWFSLAVTGYNLTNTGSKEAPLAMAIGASFGLAFPFRAALDWVIDFRTKGEVAHELRVGAEYTIAKMFPIRLGYTYDQVRDRHFLSAGLGWTYSWIAINLAYRQELATDNRLDNRYLGLTAQLVIPEGKR